MIEEADQSRPCTACDAQVRADLRFCPHCGAMVLVENERRNPDLSMIGKTIAENFLLQQVIGIGAMGTIYRAEQRSLGKTVVIKLIHLDLLDDPTLAMRFHREARASSRLNHPNCIQIIDFGEMEDGRLYIAMEHVSGRDLAQILHANFPLPTERIVHIMRQVCLGLDEAHANGVLHRDLKPENIMVGDRRNARDFVKVLDFGIAKLMDKFSTSADETLSGMVCGTPEYMSPEQARGDDIDARSDVYAVGIILYQLLTNRLPFTGENALKVMTQQLSSTPVPPTELCPDAHPALSALALQLMAKQAEHRPPTCLEVADEFERIGVEYNAQQHLQRGPDSTTRETGSARRHQISQPLPTRQDIPSTPRESAVSGEGPSSNPPGGYDIDSQEALTEEARAPVPEAKKRGPSPPVGSVYRSRAESEEHPMQLWLISLLVAAAIMLVGWILYRASGDAPAEPVPPPASEASAPSGDEPVAMDER